VIKVIGVNGEAQLFETTGTSTTAPPTDWSIFDYMILGRGPPPSSAWVPVSIDDYFKGDKQVLSYPYSTLDQLEDFARYPETATFDDFMRSNKLGWRLVAIMGKDGGPALRSCSKPQNHCATFVHLGMAAAASSRPAPHSGRGSRGIPWRKDSTASPSLQSRR
jgi:hypothetical protein